MGMFDLKDKVAVVLGGAGHLGSEFCRALLEHNAVVVCVDKDPARIKLAKGLLVIAADCLNKQKLQEVKGQILDKFNKVDVLVNSITMKGNDFYLPFDEVSQEGWEIGLSGNITAPFLACQAFIPEMAKRKQGSVINISSIYGMVGNDQKIYEGGNLHEVYVKDHPEIKQIYSHAVYPAAKGGLITLTKYLAAYYGKDNVRVNCISPGGVEYPNENETFVKKYSEKTPLGRKAKRDEINGAVVYLASDASSYVTGHNLVVDGGWTAW
jgi:NAD(P)-dependent dehydrogenase (short-subunit alcohol dehydrogenase family)